MSISRLPSPGAGIPTSTVTAKGDLIAGTANNAVSRLGVGANGTTLVADSSEATGLKWATPASGGGVTLLSTTTLSGSSTTVSSISGSYKNLYCVITGLYTNNANTLLQMYFNSDTTNLQYNVFGLRGTTVDNREGSSSPFARIAYTGNSSTTVDLSCGIINIYNYTDTTIKYWNAGFNGLSNGARAGTTVTGTFAGSTITSIKLDADGSTFSAGTIKIYGVN